MMCVRCKTRVMSLLVIMVLCMATVVHAEMDEDSMALIRAAGKCDMNEVRNLLKQGTFIDSYAFGSTALHVAAREGCADIVYFLLREGANPYSKNRDGYTPMEVAVQNGRNEVVNVLRRYEERK